MSKRARSKGQTWAYGLIGLWACGLIWIAPSAECYILSVSHLPPSQKGETFLLVTDLSGVGPSVKIGFYDDSGREVSIVNKLLPPNGKIQINVENHTKVAGTIVVESPNEQIAGEYWQVYKNRTLFMLPLQFPDGEDRYFINCFQLPSCDEVYIVISDPNGDGPMVQMEFYSRMGELIKIARKLLRPRGMLSFKVSDYAPKNMLGKVSVRSFGGGIVLHSRYLCSKKTVLAIPVCVPSKSLMIKSVLQYVPTGKKAISNLIIVDASAKGGTARISFLDNSGEVISDLEKSLPPNGSVLVDLTDYLDSVNNGMIKIASEVEIIASYWEKNPDTGYWVMDAGYWMLEESPEADIDFPVSKSKMSKSQVDISRPPSILSISYFPSPDNVFLSLLNVGQQIIRVEVQFYNNDGEKLGEKKIRLEPYNQIDEALDHYFSSSRSGTIIVREASMDLIVTSNIFDSKSHQFLGKAYAISR